MSGLNRGTTRAENRHWRIGRLNILNKTCVHFGKITYFYSVGNKRTSSMKSVYMYIGSIISYRSIFNLIIVLLWGNNVEIDTICHSYLL